MLGLPATLDVRTPDGTVAEDQQMWTYWYLQEGEVAVDPATFVTADGAAVAGPPRRQRRGRCATTRGG